MAQLGAWSWGSPMYEGLKSLCQQRGRLHRNAVKGMAGPAWAGLDRGAEPDLVTVLVTTHLTRPTCLWRR